MLDLGAVQHLLVRTKRTTGGGGQTRVPIFYVGCMQRRRELLQDYTIVFN